MDVRLGKQDEINYYRASKAERERMFEQMLSRFNSQVLSSGVFQELKKREFYEKPNEKRRRKQHEAILKRMKKDRRKSNAIRKAGVEG